MKPKAKKQNTLTKAAPNAEDLIYQQTSTDWGLTARFEDLQLVFSGEFNSAAVFKRRWQKISRIFKFKKKSGLVTDVDIYSLFSPSAQDAWDKAFTIAKKRGRDVGVEDIFLALLKETSVQNLLGRMKVDIKVAESLLDNYLKLGTAPTPRTVKKIPFEAFNLAIKLEGRKIGSLMLLGALLNATPQENILQAIFTNIGLTIDKLEVVTVWSVNLAYDFPPHSKNAKLLYCCLQAEMLEQHFGYFFEFPAIEKAVDLSSGQSLKDLEHKKALQILVKAGKLAQAKGTKVITENLVKQAAI